MTPPTLHTPEDLFRLAETSELECKLAQGRDGDGQLPRDFWPTYSAFANTHGGIVLLGLREKDGHFTVAGIENPDKIRKDLFNQLNDAGKVSLNLIRDSDVQALTLEGKTVLQIRIPAASRKQKPVYLNGNPLGNTFRRLNEADVRLSDATVRRMLSEQLEDSLDNRIFPHFGLADLDAASLHAYRNLFMTLRPDHPWNTPDDPEFLRLLGGWREDRQTGEHGLTLAGLLMFGQWPAINEALPLYFVDYRETGDRPDTDVRWLDRVIPDGSWSGNLFDFFRKVSRKLVADLKTPFVLKGAFRQDDTPLHQSLREALVNTLVHADYTDRASIRILKRPGGFEFRNPGLLRVPADIALQGGESDCRNRTLQQMFLMINLGERAGSGLPKIREAWRATGGTLTLTDSFEPYDQTLLSMAWPSDGAFSDTTTTGASEKTSEKTSEKILAAVARTPEITIQELAAHIGVTARSIERNLSKLQAEGRLRRIGPDKGGRWQVEDSSP